MLIVPFSLVLYLVDRSMLVTLLEWLAFVPVLARYTNAIIFSDLS